MEMNKKLKDEYLKNILGAFSNLYQAGYRGETFLKHFDKWKQLGKQIYNDDKFTKIQFETLLQQDNTFNKLKQYNEVFKKMKR